MSNAVIYARHSDAPHRTDAPNSAQRQVEVCRRYLELRGYTLAHEPFVDEDRSGKRAMDDRPEGAKMLAFLRQRPQPATIVAMTELDRGWRDPIDALEVVQQWGRAGIAVHFVAMGGNSIDTSTPIGKYVFGQLALFARLQREIIGERTSRRMRSNQESGRRMSKEPPYGKRIDPNSQRDPIVDHKTGEITGYTEPKGLMVDEDEVRVIRHILDLRKHGRTPWAIMRELNESGTLFRGRPWQYKTMRRVIERGLPNGKE